MTHYLTSQSAQVQQMRNLTLVAQGAVQERNAVLKQLSGLKELTNEYHHSQQDVLHHKDRANQLEMELLRVEAHLGKTKKALWDTTTSHSELMDRVKSLEAEKAAWIAEREQYRGLTDDGRDKGIIRDVADSFDLEIDSAPIVDEDGTMIRVTQLQPTVYRKSIDTQERGVQATPSPTDVANSVPMERHDKLLREVVRLKFVVQDLTRNQGLHYKKVMKAAEYEDQIKQLREELQSRTGELQQLKHNIYHAKKDKDTAGKLMETQLQLEKVIKANDMKQVLNETLSRHIEELTSLLKESQNEVTRLKQPEYLMAYQLSSGSKDVEETKKDIVDDQLQQASGGDESDGTPRVKTSIPPQSVAVSLSLTADSITSDQSTVTKSTEEGLMATTDSQTEPMKQKRPQWEQSEKEMILGQQVKHLREKVERLSQDCKRLLTDKVMAIREKGVYETRYNDLMDTVKQTKSSQSSSCSTCRSSQDQIKKLQEEMQNMKSEIEMVTAQRKLFEEDLEQEQLDSRESKERYKSQIESWQKNCATLGKQVTLFKADLVKERQKTKKLEQRIVIQQQAASQIMQQRGGPYFTMQTDAAPYHQQSCASDIGPFMSPWQAGYRRPGELVTDGEGRDEYDGREPHSEFKSALMSQQADASGRGQENECPRCRRIFGSHEQQEFHEHVDKCMDT